MHDDLPSAVPVPETDARPVPVLYTFTCGGAKAPCKLTYTYESDLHNQRRLLVLPEREPKS